MPQPNTRPGFFESWLDDAAEDARRYGPRALLPWKAAFCLGLGAFGVYFIPADEFWKPEVSLVYLTAILTVNGLLLALSWGSFAKIYELASEPRMIEFLNRHNKVNMYIFHVNYIHYAQILSLLVSFGTMLVAVIKLPETSFVSENLLRYYSLSLTIATSLYALSYALGAVRMMQDLVWYAADMSASSGREAAVYSLRGSRPD